jgi:RNA polymerase sigma-70 factor (ECF subfamily)
MGRRSVEDVAVQSLTDTQLARLSRGGNGVAFEFLARRWGPHLHRFLIKVLGNEEEAREVGQDALLRAYQRIDSLRDPRNFKAWLFRIAFNLSRDRLRHRQRQPTVPLDGLDAEGEARGPLTSSAPTPLEVAEQSDLAGILRQVLARLPVEQRVAIVLRELQGFNSEQIGQITGAPAATIRSRIYYGLRTLRRLLPEHGVTSSYLESCQGG